MPELGKNKELAYAFVEYANSGDGVATRIKEGAFPATTAELQDSAFLNKEFPYFGGQKANEIFAESAANVASGLVVPALPAYANSIFNDTVGKAYVVDTKLAAGLKSWQDAVRQVRQGAGLHRRVRRPATRDPMPPPLCTLRKDHDDLHPPVPAERAGR